MASKLLIINNNLIDINTINLLEMLNFSGILNTLTEIWCYCIAEIRQQAHAISPHHANTIKK
ncbi:hypothetical protein BHC46_05735 [Snodgrassella alvi]|uniref:Uncharacterized protein n=1 Tax=Snodgrassella alvi TaxID=1196083 RepID=A0A2N9XHI1_9NEIS|nr:hypothetical protein BHC46_05735 [Snodgrassella alvi]